MVYPFRKGSWTQLLHKIINVWNFTKNLKRLKFLSDITPLIWSWGLQQGFLTLGNTETSNDLQRPRNYHGCWHQVWRLQIVKPVSVALVAWRCSICVGFKKADYLKCQDTCIGWYLPALYIIYHKGMGLARHHIPISFFLRSLPWIILNCIWPHGHRSQKGSLTIVSWYRASCASL